MKFNADRSLRYFLRGRKRGIHCDILLLSFYGVTEDRPSLERTRDSTTRESRRRLEIRGGRRMTDEYRKNIDRKEEEEGG